MATNVRDLIAADPTRPVVVRHHTGLMLETQPSSVQRLRVVIRDDKEWVYYLRRDHGALKFFGVYGQVMKVDQEQGVIEVTFVTGTRCKIIAALVRAQEGAQSKAELHVHFAHKP